MTTGSILLLAASIITNISVLSNTGMPEARFQVEGVVTFACNTMSGVVMVEDGHNNAVRLANETDPFHELNPGDVIRASGRTAIDESKTIRLNCNKIEVIGAQPAPMPVPASVKDLIDGKFVNRFITTEATLRDVFLDELDPDEIYLVLQDGSDTIINPHKRDDSNLSHFNSIVGTRIRATGVCTLVSGWKIQCGWMLATKNKDSLEVLEPPPKCEFDLPGIDELQGLHPSRIAQSGRCRTVGTVIATWGQNKMLVKDYWARLTEVELAEQELPPYRTMVEVAGLPASNLIRTNLLRAKWRKTLGQPMEPETAEAINVKSLFTDEKNRFRYDQTWHGRTIRIRGTVKAMTTGEHTDGRFYLESDSYILTVDTVTTPKAIDRVKVGYEVEVTGVCIMEREKWSPYSAFPQTHGVLLVVRTSDDIRVVARPSWWTAGRLLSALGVLLAVLGGILFWNMQLRAAVKKRETALKREIFANVNSDMKMRERNNLSIELHDSLSQGLTGVSMEIDTAQRLADNPAEMNRHLKLAAKSLKSCRNELKACIYDLRTNTLDDCDMNESIRRTLVPFISDMNLSIRFNVPRNLISDNIAHNVLRIIRELVVNAVRHGQASSVKIAGSIAGQTLCFSVQDNGCGFDPTTCPGPDQGHFGLQGIRERLKRLNGSLTIGGKGINGTRAAVMIELQTERSEQ
jgi:signal transduction histidine kinase